MFEERENFLTRGNHEIIVPRSVNYANIYLRNAGLTRKPAGGIMLE